MRIITAPSEDYSLEHTKNYKVMMAGGITNCPNWQVELIQMFTEKCPDAEISLFNPRRENFPIDNPGESERQIVWEFNKFREADAHIFWFSRGSLNPITLYELGRYGNSGKKPLCIGIDEEYQRKQDVIIQTQLSRKKPLETHITYSLELIFLWIHQMARTHKMIEYYTPND